MRVIVSLLAAGLMLVAAPASLPAPAQAQTSERPFILPVGGEPGPGGWLFGQAYGNTTGAYNFGDQWYSAGQGLHFGLDLAMPCGTPLLAVGDGEVLFVDNLSFGSGPHNLLIRHDAGFVSLYGHLLEPPALMPGQRVAQGQVVGLSGDPDLTCVSRPHLHYELRSLDYRTTYNPIPYMEANWHALASAGAYGYPLFQQDMFNARRWMTLEDQPEVVFGGRRLNDYAFTWPLDRDSRPPDNAPVDRDLPAPPADAVWSLRQVGFDGCCVNSWWHPTDPDRLLVIDGGLNARANVQAWSAETGSPVEVVESAPPAPTSPDGAISMYAAPSYVTLRRHSDGAEWVAYTGAAPAISADNSKLMWITRGGASVPGQAAPPTSLWVADITGENARMILSDAGLNAQWLDADRLLITQSFVGRITALTVYDTRDNRAYSLGNFRNLRGFDVAPGGGRLLFMLTWQDDPATNGVYTLETIEGAVPERLPWFGGWRWLDRDSLLYLPLDATSPHHALAYYDIASGENRVLVSPETLPFTVMNGDWDISADGRRIAFHDATTGQLTLLEWSLPG